jgi:hypothetical protein
MLTECQRRIIGLFNIRIQLDNKMTVRWSCVDYHSRHLLAISPCSARPTCATSYKYDSGLSNSARYVVDGITLGGEAAQAVVKIGFTGKLIAISAYPC